MFFCMVIALSGCAFKKKVDPYEGLNRGMFLINKTVDKLYIKPIACAYDKFLPKPYRYVCHCFLKNIRTIPTIINDILQCKIKEARKAAARFTVNSTLGVGGLIDVASLGKMEEHQNDFGLTMAHYGYKDSIYIVLPLAGPCTVRDTIGRGVDTFLSIGPFIRPAKLGWALFGLYLIDTRAKLLQAEPILAEAVVDEYTFMRDAYLQNRRYQMKEGKEGGEAGSSAEVSVTPELENPGERDDKLTDQEKKEKEEKEKKEAEDKLKTKEQKEAEEREKKEKEAMEANNSLDVIHSSDGKTIGEKGLYINVKEITGIQPKKLDLTGIKLYGLLPPANPEDIKGSSTMTNAVGGQKK